MKNKHPLPDHHLWHQETTSIRPLKGTKSPPDPQTPSQTETRTSSHLPRTSPAPDFTPPAPGNRGKTWGISGSARLLVFHSNTATRTAAIAPHTDAKLLKNLASGKIPPTATIDLHGLKEHEAFQILIQWIHDAATHDHRCVTVVTGKGSGYGPNGDIGILKYKTPQWLSEHPQVLALHTALPKDGGTGAFYVYLRRAKA